MNSYVDDKLESCHDNYLSVKSIPFCKGERTILGRVEVGVPHMHSFWDWRVTNTNLSHRNTWFLRSSKNAASFLYEFLCEVGQNNYVNTNCSRGDTCITPLFVFDVHLDTTCDQL